LWRYEGRPDVTDEQRTSLEARLDPDLSRLGQWLGAKLTCSGWREQVLQRALEWEIQSPPRDA